MRRVAGLIILLLACCGPIQSGQVADQINAMVGLSQEHALSCMGPPSSTAHVGGTEVWSYNVGGPVTTSAVMSGDQSAAVGSATTSQEFCIVNLTIQDGSVVAANYRSQGKLLAPSLPCYSVLHACAPNPASASTAAPGQTLSDKTKDAVAFCKELYADPRLAPLRGVISIEAAPSLSMQSNKDYATDEQRTALDAYQPLHEECRNKLMAANPHLAKIMVQVQPAPYANLRALYKRKITIGEFNTRKQDELDELKAALVNPTK